MYDQLCVIIIKMFLFYMKSVNSQGCVVSFWCPASFHVIQKHAENEARWIRGCLKRFVHGGNFKYCAKKKSHLSFSSICLVCACFCLSLSFSLPRTFSRFPPLIWTSLHFLCLAYSVCQKGHDCCTHS